MANADTPEDALTARKNGAEGIGLCRTEHMVSPSLFVSLPIHRHSSSSSMCPVLLGKMLEASF